jgi:hypothetical protein
MRDLQRLRRMKIAEQKTLKYVTLTSSGDVTPTSSVFQLQRMAVLPVVPV